ncbi:hypothetical protein XaC1_217 [Xanthomonas phage XaC1]|nr:hypothetical protein XaC1_217 [Xanthomonas phage XaC1]
MDIDKAKYIEFLNEMGLLDSFEYLFDDGTVLCKDETFMELGDRTVAHCTNDKIIIHVCTESYGQVELSRLGYVFAENDTKVVKNNTEYSINNKEEYFNASILLDLTFSYDEIQYLSKYYNDRLIGATFYYIEGDEKYTGNYHEY